MSSKDKSLPKRLAKNEKRILARAEKGNVEIEPFAFSKGHGIGGRIIRRVAEEARRKGLPCIIRPKECR